MAGWLVAFWAIVVSVPCTIGAVRAEPWKGKRLAIGSALLLGDVGVVEAILLQIAKVRLKHVIH